MLPIVLHGRTPVASSTLRESAPLDLDDVNDARYLAVLSVAPQGRVLDCAILQAVLTGRLCFLLRSVRLINTICSNRQSICALHARERKTINVSHQSLTTGAGTGWRSDVHPRSSPPAIPRPAPICAPSRRC